MHLHIISITSEIFKLNYELQIVGGGLFSKRIAPRQWLKGIIQMSFKISDIKEPASKPHSYLSMDFAMIVL